MSSIAPIENVVVEPVKVVKAKKPTLSVKLQKFASSIYSILQTLNEQGLISDEAIETAVTEQFHLFDPLDNLEQQTVILQALLDKQPAELKSFRKIAIARNKPPKAVKTPKAPKAPKEKVVKEPKEKVPRAKKVKAVEPPVEPSIELVNEVISPVVLPEPVSTEAKPKRVRKTKKVEAVVEPEAAIEPAIEPAAVAAAVEEVVAPTPTSSPVVKAKKEKAPKATKEPKAPKATKEPKAPKEKAVKEPKEKVSKKTTPKVTSDASDDLIGQIVAAARSTVTEPQEPEVDEDDEDVIQTREFSFEGTLYLIDQDNQLYSYSSHDHIGAFEPTTNSINLL